MADLETGRKERYFKAGNYALYYGRGRETELSNFNIAIVEPSGQNAASVGRMHESGTIVIAYLSVMEIHPLSLDFKLLKEEDFLEINSGPVMNSSYGTYLLNLHSKRWNDLLFHYADNLIFNQGYDGFFLDTIADVEHQYLPQDIRRLQFLSAVDFTRKLRDKFPSHIIIQNNGIEELCIYTSESIDGICLENPFYFYKGNAVWANNITKRLRMLGSEHKLKIFLLVEGKELRNRTEGEAREYLSKIHEIGMSNGFLVYTANNSYAEI